ncbi:molybdopterin molybdenumtransferase MoeA [Methanobrevibacter sp. TMH8]|uniref:molybdenum cofactor synthesis domain-containing protein n=1 Tax=Methanobrevibacter sp. TMH8 TaxID=2848611 RepID=UPI001CCC5C96|nr:gephyrin-like molybdotransferase Glp [Methanobrevibacter sp. TMH8]MBZ9571190.1 molybdopterin molybdenumtransferase MoeA [Methanobrevibacter sp. TMH8]
MGTEFLNIKEVDEAKKIIKDLFNELYPPKSDIVSIEDSYNHVIFKDIISSMDLPPFNRSLMDGFAVKAEDTFGANDEHPKILKCIDSIEAGSYSEKTIEKGECIEISTGAPIPDGADAVAMVEFTERGSAIDEENDIYILKSVAPNQDLALKGSDITKEKTLLKEKTVIGPDKIGVLAAQGIKEVEVYKKPRIAVISTGNELVLENEKNKNGNIEYGKIYDVNSYAITSGAISNGAIAENKGIVKDNYQKLKKQIKNSLEDFDIVICSGGTSAGVGDVLRHVLDEIGKVIMHGISVKPGKPTLVGKVNEKLVIGLPGNPVSALIIFYVFIVPNIRRLSGKGSENIEKTKAILAKRIHSPKGRIHYNLVQLKDGLAYPIVKDSGAITSLAHADGYIKISKTIELVDEGKEVEITLFR